MIRFDGTNWITLPPIYPNLTSGSVCVPVLEYYNGIFYAGGNWGDGSFTMDDLAMFDTVSNTWIPFGQPLNGFLSGITDMTVYKGELYIAGAGICTCYGDPGNGILKWNGSQLLPVGSGTMPMAATVWDLHIFDDKLWAVGEFIGMGNQPASHVAYWDSVQWHGINGTFDNTVLAVTSLNGDLYFGGGFWKVNNDSVYKIVKYTPLTSVNDPGQENKLVKYFPNPATNNLNISYPLSSDNRYFYLMDVNGRVILQRDLTPGSSENRISLEGIPSGVYLTEIRDDKIHFGKNKLIILH
jgi:hypothetical protein